MNSWLYLIDLNLTIWLYSGNYYLQLRIIDIVMISLHGYNHDLLHPKSYTASSMCTGLERDLGRGWG